MLDKEKYLHIVESDFDKAYRGVRAAIGLIPMASGTFLEVFEALVTDPSKARVDCWMSDVVDAINELYELNIVTDSGLIKDDEFISILNQASQLVLKNHQSEKLEYLRNAIRNSLIRPDVMFDKKFIFICLIEQLSVTHLEALKLIKSGFLVWSVPNKVKFTGNMNAAVTLCKQLKFDFDNTHFAEQVLNDLKDKVLCFDVRLILGADGRTVSHAQDRNTDAILGGVSVAEHQLGDEGNHYQFRLTALGEEFLQFIGTAVGE